MINKMCVLSVIALIACRSTETPEPASIPPPEPKEVNYNLGGFAWIFELKETTEFPGYRGIFLGKDGRLLLINFPNAIGDKWRIQGNWLSLDLLQGTPKLMDIPLTHNFLIVVDSVEDGLPRHIRLIPEYNCDTMGIPLTRGIAEVDLVQNYWLLKTLIGTENVKWPIDVDIHMILLPGENGLGILGHGGVNRFKGSIELGDETFKLGPLASTRMNGPYLDFETLYFSGLMSVNRYVQVDFNLFLYSDTTPVAAFRARMFD